jgi:hypothetical protein
LFGLFLKLLSAIFLNELEFYQHNLFKTEPCRVSIDQG